MGFVLSDRFQKIFDDLRKTELPQMGDYFLFDLSRDEYRESVIRLKDIDEVYELTSANRPYAVVWYNKYQNYPELYINGVSFSKTLDLESQRTIRFYVREVYDIKEVKEQLLMLTELFKSEAS